jgi:hypothetical protein
MGLSRAPLFVLTLPLLACEPRVRLVGEGECGDRACDAGARSEPLPVAWDASYEPPGEVGQLDAIASELAGVWWGVVRQNLDLQGNDVTRETTFELEFTPRVTGARDGEFSLHCVTQPDCDPLLVGFAYGLPGDEGRYELVFVSDTGAARGSFLSPAEARPGWEIGFRELRIQMDGEREILRFALGSENSVLPLGEAILVRGPVPDGGGFVTPAPHADGGTADAGLADDGGSGDGGFAGDAATAAVDGGA